MSEYLIFIHGVNTRMDRDQPSYADQLIDDINRLCSTRVTIKSIPLYWGDVNVNEEQDLLKDLQGSHVWKKLAFQDFRAHQVLQFAGDAALYISRAVGQLIIERLIKQASDGLRDFDPANDHIHLITHSMGTIILFDVLFSTRWDEDNAGGYTGVEQLRHLIFQGRSPMRSIHTLGSPIGMFSLTMRNVSSLPNTHDVTARLKKYLNDLCGVRHMPFPWRNYLHPMDIIAMPIEQLLPKILASEESCLDVKDVLIQDAAFLESIGPRFLPLISGENGSEERVERLQFMLFGANAHSSYWSSPVVASTIVQTIETSLLRSPLGAMAL